MTSPATLERARIHVVDQNALPVDDVNLAGVLVEVETPLGNQDVGLLIVLFEWRRTLRRTVVKVPKQLAIAREFEDAVLRRSSAYPDVALAIDQDSLQCSGPEGMISRASPRVNHIAFLVQLDGLGAPDAAVNPRRVTVPAYFIAVGSRSTIQEPDVACLFFHIKACHLLHAPSIGQGLRPERIHFEHGRTLRIHCLSLLLGFLLRLQAAARNRGEGQQKTDSKNHGGQSVSFFPYIHRTLLLLASNATLSHLS